jgi:hypothetical protein
MDDKSHEPKTRKEVSSGVIPVTGHTSRLTKFYVIQEKVADS